MSPAKVRRGFLSARHLPCRLPFSRVGGAFKFPWFRADFVVWLATANTQRPGQNVASGRFLSWAGDLADYRATWNILKFQEFVPAATQEVGECYAGANLTQPQRDPSVPDGGSPFGLSIRKPRSSSSDYDGFESFLVHQCWLVSTAATRTRVNRVRRSSQRSAPRHADRVQTPEARHLGQSAYPILFTAFTDDRERYIYYDIITKISIPPPLLD